MTTMGPRDASEASRTATEVESLAQNVILHFGLPFTVLSVVRSSNGWELTVRADTGAVTKFTVHGSRPIDIRVAIQATLESQA
jgi:hypothetical protein